MEENMDTLLMKKFHISQPALSKILNYIFYFFIFSFLGWIIETIFCYIVDGIFTKRGFLYGPICPIYGWGSLLLIIYLEHTNHTINYVKMFFLFIVIFSFFEYFVGFTLDALFSETWWDYSESKYNINGRITLLNSFLWGVITVLFTKIIYPIVNKIKEKIIDSIHMSYQAILAIVLVSTNVIDVIFSCIRYLTY